jgi:hypothetical protein
LNSIKSVKQYMGYRQSTFEPYINKVESQIAKLIQWQGYRPNKRHCASILNSGKGFFSFPVCPLCLLGVPSFLFDWYWELIPGSNAAKTGNQPLTYCSTEVKNKWTISPLSHMPLSYAQE